MKTLSGILEKQLNTLLSLKEDDWIKWIARENTYKDDCDKINGCYFIVRQMPAFPYHPNCQCRLEQIQKPKPYTTAVANCDVRKFTEYIFNEKNNEGKRVVFNRLGYQKSDSYYLQNLYISQAIEKYCNGEYTYKGVGYYPRIEIVIELKKEKYPAQKIKTGWVVLPGGEIKNATPFSGYTREN